MSWHKCRVADLGRIVTGGTPPTSKRQYYGSFCPLIKPTDMVKDGFRIGDTEESLSPEGFELFRNRVVPTETPCVVTIGTIGKLCLTREQSVCNQAVNSIVVNRQNHDPYFVFYLMKTCISKVRFLSSGTASGRENVSKSAFEGIEVCVPSLEEQEYIGQTLRNYDELIENGQRRIQILDEMARSLYREWFVNFRFPGHEKTKLVDSSVGAIPQGWEVKNLGELTAYLNRGLAPTYDEAGDSVVINQKCIRDQRLSLEPARRQSRAVSSEKQIRFGDVLINSTGVGTLGRVAQVYEELERTTVDTHVSIARPTTAVDVDFFGCALLHKQDSFERLGVGATGQTELNRTAIGGVELVVPPAPLQRRFGSAARPIRSEAVILQRQIQNLRRTRDLLLPRLLSGQVELQGN